MSDLEKDLVGAFIMNPELHDKEIVFESLFDPFSENIKGLNSSDSKTKEV